MANLCHGFRKNDILFFFINLDIYTSDINRKMPKIDTLDALEEHEEHDDDYAN